jgi:hypothetical protein
MVLIILAPQKDVWSGHEICTHLVTEKPKRLVVPGRVFRADQTVQKLPVMMSGVPGTFNQIYSTVVSPQGSGQLRPLCTT